MSIYVFILISVLVLSGFGNQKKCFLIRVQSNIALDKLVQNKDGLPDPI